MNKGGRPYSCGRVAATSQRALSSLQEGLFSLLGGPFSFFCMSLFLFCRSFFLSCMQSGWKSLPGLRPLLSPLRTIDMVSVSSASSVLKSQQYVFSAALSYQKISTLQNAVMLRWRSVTWANYALIAPHGANYPIICPLQVEKYQIICPFAVFLLSLQHETKKNFQ